jgi:hypothetical protein
MSARNCWADGEGRQTDDARPAVAGSVVSRRVRGLAVRCRPRQSTTGAAGRWRVGLAYRRFAPRAPDTPHVQNLPPAIGPPSPPTPAHTPTASTVLPPRVRPGLCGLLASTPRARPTLAHDHPHTLLAPPKISHARGISRCRHGGRPITLSDCHGRRGTRLGSAAYGMAQPQGAKHRGVFERARGSGTWWVRDPPFDPVRHSTQGGQEDIPPRLRGGRTSR